MSTITPETIVHRSAVVEPFLYVVNSSPGVEVFVGSHFPSFVREDHPKFLDFMESYYLWLNSVGNPLHDSSHIPAYQDIDQTNDVFREQFFKEFLSNIPRGVQVNVATILKHIKQFYRAKGTEKSFKFLFRLLFNQNVEIYYPKVDILRVSDGKWIKNKSIKLVNVSGDPNDLIGRTIRGTSNNSTGFVERIFRSDEGALRGYELILNTSSITGRFIPNEPVTTVDTNGPKITGKISPIPTEVQLTVRGKNYDVNDTFEIVGNFPGSGAVIRVVSVDEEGAINTIELISYGLGYSDESPTILDFPLSKPSITNPSDIARVNISIGATTNYPGYYLNEDGQISASKYIHDGEYYQQFSYVTYADQSKNYYEDAMNKLVHPLGFKNFGGVRIVQLLNATIKPAQARAEVHLIANPSASGLGQEVATHVSLDHVLSKDARSPALGASNKSILREKFNYKPFLKYDANLDFNQTTNPNYFGVALIDPRGNTPVAAFEKLGLSRPAQIEEMFGDKTNIMPDAVVYTSIQSEVGDGNQVVRLIEETDPNKPDFVEITNNTPVE